MPPTPKKQRVTPPLPSSLPQSLKDSIEAYCQNEPGAEWREKVASLASSALSASPDTWSSFGKRLAFGTAGLRGPMVPGQGGMNDYSVITATQGLARVIADTHKGKDKVSIVLGFDGRHHSLEFAKLTCATFLRAASELSDAPAFHVEALTRLAATPLVSYGIRRSGAHAGVMVTASHNVASDNGYKVYWGNSAQIIPPIDSQIAKAISSEEQASIDEHSRATWLSAEEVAAVKACASFTDLAKTIGADAKRATLSDITDDLAKEYFATIGKKLCYRREANSTGDFPIVFTAMHGVGKEWVTRAFEEFGLPPFIPVAEQIEADPDFSTVAFPNPEEGKGALKVSFAAAEAAGSNLVLANDPDSDRLAIAERQPSGEWRIFTGNEIGALLADWCVERYLEAHPSADVSKLLLVNTTVSSKWLAHLARAKGLRYEETLTGFKWIGNRALDLIENEGYTFIFGFEEAIGFMPGDTCFDKDGVRSAALAAEMAREYHFQRKQTLQDRLAWLQKEYDGPFITHNSYFICRSPDTMKAIFTRIATLGGGAAGTRAAYPAAAGSFAIKDVRDLSSPGFDSRGPVSLPTSASSPMFTFYFENGTIVTLRGSGTEPKLKYYCELPSGSVKGDANKVLQEVVDAVIKDFLEPEKNKLEWRKAD